MIDYTYPAELQMFLADGRISLIVDVGFEMVHVQAFRVANIEIKDWMRYFDFVDHRLSLSPKIYVRSKKVDGGYTADITYQRFEDANWYNLALELVEADIATRSN